MWAKAKLQIFCELVQPPLSLVSRVNPLGLCACVCLSVIGRVNRLTKEKTPVFSRHKTRHSGCACAFNRMHRRRRHRLTALFVMR